MYLGSGFICGHVLCVVRDVQCSICEKSVYGLTSSIISQRNVGEDAGVI